MSEHHYSTLPSNSIRLLRLLPSSTNLQNIQCELFEYPLHNSDKSSRPYEALSYVWGSEEKPKSIIVDGKKFYITESLYKALLQLQDHSCSRTIWIDAICINQENNEEKETQIPFMAEIYAKASSVVVWLGPADDDSDVALEAIRLVGANLGKVSKANIQEPIKNLLQRQWFRRAWVRTQRVLNAIRNS
jgi:hypothetical protein